MKAATGYWNCIDPTNGFLAIRREIFELLPKDRIGKRFFFETSMLGELYLINAVVKEIPYPAFYGNEISNLSIFITLIEFPPKLLSLFIRRVWIKYFLFNFNLASLYLIFGTPMLLLGLIFGISKWIKYSQLGIPAPTGTIMVPTLLVILSVQLLLSAITIDFNATPKEPISKSLIIKEKL